MTSDFVELCIGRATAHQSRCSEDVVALEGKSSQKVRHLLNNLCGRKGTRYLEIGVWKGATFCSAVCGNELKAVAVDNFSQFGGTRDEFLKNYAATIGGTPNLCDLDFREFSASEYRFNVYFYDGNHSHEDQRAAITHFVPFLDSEFILVIDDWNSPPVRTGTRQGIEESRLEIVKSWELPARFNGDLEYWWNGLFVAVCRIPATVHGPPGSTGSLCVAHGISEVEILTSDPALKSEDVRAATRGRKWRGSR